MLLEHESLLNDVTHYLSSTKSQKWLELIKLIEKVYDDNPYDPQNERNCYLMWQEQCGINFPLLYITSIYLYIYAQERECDTFLFATRDCCHWYKIFQKLFPEANAHYFHCSRNMFEKATDNDNETFDDYVKSLIKTDISKTIFIDIHGSGQRAFYYFRKAFGEVPYCFLLSASYRNYADFPSICREYAKKNKLFNLVFDARGSPIEMLNYDIIGTLQDYSAKNGPIRDPLEYRMSRLESYHTCIDYIVDHLKQFPYDLAIDQNELISLIKKIYRVIQDNKPIISIYIMHPARHKKTAPDPESLTLKTDKKKHRESKLFG